MSRKQRPNRKVFQVLQRPIQNGTGTKGGGVAEFSQEMFHNKFALSLSIFCGYLLLIGLRRADPEKSERTIATPQKSAGHAVPRRRRCCTPLLGPTGGSLSSLLIPAGRLKTARQAGR